MKFCDRGLLAAAFVILFNSAALAQSEPTLTAYKTIEGDLVHLGVRLQGASGPFFRWMFTFDDPGLVAAPQLYFLGNHLLDAEGNADTHLIVGTEVILPEPVTLYFCSFYVEDHHVMQSPFATLVLDDVISREEPVGDELDFDWGMGGVTLSAGTIISDVQPWSEFMSISASDGLSAILFDSGNGDSDLGTPGTGAGNDEALGQLLVIGANTIDNDNDGLVDVPQANPMGGTLIFDFVGNTTLGSVRLVDVDEPGGELRALLADGNLITTPIPVGQNNGVQYLFGSFGVVRLEIELTGTAGVGSMVVNPCLSIVNFDEITTGVPLGLVAGQEMPGLDGPLVFFTANNNNPTHPNKAILFDSAHPTGADNDLLTPGSGLDNNEAHRKLLIISENDVDSDDDGIIDVPDDEANGGSLSMAYYTSCAFFHGATVVDVDLFETATIEVHLDDGGSVIIPLESKGNNSVQTITADHIGPTRWIEFHFSGSAGVAEIVVCPNSGEL